MEYLWRPRGVAVIGVSATPGAVGNQALRYLRAHGYPGAIYPVNPRLTEIDGLPCFRSLQAVDGPVDLALIAVGAERTRAILADCAAKGVAYAILFSSGFGETGAQGQALEAELVAFARAHGIRLLGPNCIGLVSPADRLVAGFSPLLGSVTFRPGSVGLVAQSGALGFGIASLALERGIEFSRIITTGNEADLSTAELVRALLLDEATQVLLVYAEGLKQGPLWREIGALSQRLGKPVIILKAGRTAAGARAATSHTAALAGDDAVWAAAFRQLGLLRVDDLDEMLDLAAAFAAPGRPSGARVAVLTTSGGAGILAVDALERLGLPVPALGPAAQAALAAIVPPYGSVTNPVDVTAQVIGAPELFERALRAVVADPQIDLLLVCFCVLQGAAAERVVEAVLRVRREWGGPVLVARTGAESLAPVAAARLREGGVPVYQTPAQAARAAAALVRFASGAGVVSAAAPLPKPGSAPAGWPVGLAGCGDGATSEESTQSPSLMTERATKALLHTVGLPLTPDHLAESPEEAVRAAEAIGYPVVLKLDDPTIAHKTEVGGVRLNLPDATAVRQGFTAIAANRPGARCLVQPLVTGAVAELLVGVSPSPMGPVITVGLGGVQAEVWREVTRRLAPLTEREALAMLQELRLWRVLTGYRGRPAADVGALARLIARVSEFALTWPGEWELDLNPVFALPEGCVIADGLLIVKEVGPC